MCNDRPMCLTMITGNKFSRQHILSVVEGPESSLTCLMSV
jgi:hypothetical protein